MLVCNQLKKRQRIERDNFLANLLLPFLHTLSWLSRSALCKKGSNDQFIFLWNDLNTANFVSQTQWFDF
jgi:hypothetical protein